MSQTNIEPVAEAARSALAGVVPLPVGTLPCRTCGVAVRDGDGVQAEPIIARRYGFDGRLIAEEEQAAVHCAACAAVEAEVRPLMVRYMLAGAQRDRVAGVLHAFDLLGGPEIAFTDGDDFVALLEQPLGIDNPAPFGAVAELVGFAGAAKIRACATERFGHVDPALRRSLREAAARWMRQRLERPAPIAPPRSSALRGCVMCGVGTVVALPSRSHEAWSETYVSASALGAGNGAAGAVDGFTCPACTAAIASTDGPGVAALEAAVLAFVGYERRSLTPPTIHGLRGWALVEGARPNARPWGHVDLAGLRRSLASFEGGAS